MQKFTKVVFITILAASLAACGDIRWHWDFDWLAVRKPPKAPKKTKTEIVHRHIYEAPMRSSTEERGECETQPAESRPTVVSPTPTPAPPGGRVTAEEAEEEEEECSPPPKKVSHLKPPRIKTVYRSKSKVVYREAPPEIVHRPAPVEIYEGPPVVHIPAPPVVVYGGGGLRECEPRYSSRVVTSSRDHHSRNRYRHDWRSSRHDRWDDRRGGGHSWGRGGHSGGRGDSHRGRGGSGGHSGSDRGGSRGGSGGHGGRH